MQNKKCDLVYLIVLCLTILSSIIHVVVDAIIIAGNISTSAPWTVAFIWFIPYAGLALLETITWLIIRRKNKGK